MSQKGFQNRGKIAPKSDQLRSEGAFEGFLKINRKSTPESIQWETNWEPQSSTKCVNKRGRFQEGSWGARGSMLGRFWEPFWMFLSA